MHHQIYWTVEKLKKRLALIEPRVYRQCIPIPPFEYVMLPNDGLPDLQQTRTDWQPIPPNSYWGAWQTNFLLRTQFTLPDTFTEPVALYLPLGDSGDFSHPEALIYIDGDPYAACDRHHQEVLLPKHLQDGKVHTLHLHLWTGLGSWQMNEPDTKLFMRECVLVRPHQPTRDLIALARNAIGTAELLSDHDPAKDRLLTLLDRAFLALDLREPLDNAFYESVPNALQLLQEGLASVGAPLPVDIVAIGHAHIDVAWLWTLAQTRRKAGRTFHTVLRLMEQFPAYQFTQSQPQLYEYVLEDYPTLFEAIKEQVQNGRWEPIGGMWVEADCNLTGAEALARQFLLGRQFFRQHFGAEAESPVLWLPDVFGYAWALPQLIKQAGLKYFMTIKIGWSQYNRLPYDSFWWQGLDGTKVLTHFSTTPESGSQYASTYNANITPQQVLGTWQNFQQKELEQPLLMSFGYGDGGGGPTPEMLENAQAFSQIPSMPRVQLGTVKQFFERMATAVGEQLPTWNGELYLEYHRGTYTTQARNKRANRQSERLLHDAEFVCAWLAQLDPSYNYPTETFTRLWRLLCLNQFHDIIPGSSIGAVYEDSLAQYEALQAEGTAVLQTALQKLAQPHAGELLLINPTSFERSDLVWLAGQQGQWQTVDGTLLPSQAEPDGTWLAPPPLPPYSITALQRTQQAHFDKLNAPSLEASPTHLENSLLRVELNADGDITRLYDKESQRELLPSGAIANQWQAFMDRPLNWDAWDVDIFYEEQMWLAEPATAVRVTASGPLCATLTIERQILNSPYTQTLSLHAKSKQLTIQTRIHWQEKHILLKVAFPVDILAPTATHGIQWGQVERPTHRNSSWDWARFETCAHKWVDLSEGDYGVSLLNDCKYGHDIHQNVIRLSLLRSPTHPDPHADEGWHEFGYALWPHNGRLSHLTTAQASLFNDPILLVEGSQTGNKTTSPQSLIWSEQPNVVIETIKQAEDGNGLIVRLYESQRQRGWVTLHTSLPVREVWQTNLLEEAEKQLPLEGNNIRLYLTPFQIVTLRLKT